MSLCRATNAKDASSLPRSGAAVVAAARKVADEGGADQWRLVAALAPYRLRGLPERAWWGMGICIQAVRAKRREARS